MGNISCKSQKSNIIIIPSVEAVSKEELIRMAGNDLLFYLDINVGYKGYTQKELIEAWSNDIEQVLQSKQNGTVLQAWKIVGERRAFVVYKATTPQSIDKISFDSPLMKKLGDQVTIRADVLRPYYSWYSELRERTGDNSEVMEDPPSQFDASNKDACYFLVTMDIGYDGIGQEEFLKVWYEEAQRAVKAKSLGYVVDIFKVIAERKVYIIFKMPNAAALDKLMLNVPLSKAIGDRIKLDVKVIVPYEHFLDTLRS